MVDAIVITRSLRGGHYRATARHDKEPTEWLPGTFTEEQLAMLEADLDLEVVVLDAPGNEPEGGSDAEPKQEEAPAPEAPEGEAAGEPRQEQDPAPEAPVEGTGDPQPANTKKTKGKA